MPFPCSCAESWSSPMVGPHSPLGLPSCLAGWLLSLLQTADAVFEWDL
jgi:hypothetical protein